MLLQSSSYHLLPSKPGIYLFSDEKNNILYIGKAKNLKQRVSSYFSTSIVLGEKTKALVSQTKSIKYIIVGSEIQALLLESFYIKKYKPKYNIKLTDGKAYPLIRITIKDRYPKVLIERKKDDKNSVYFGPYPYSKPLYTTLKTIRRIFPYQSSINHPLRPCLYYHLDLCPCPYVFDSQELITDYRKNIKHLMEFLKGNSKKVIKDLKKERDSLSNNEKFEKAFVIQKKIDSINLITSSSYDTFDYSIDPNLPIDLQQKETESLKRILNKNDIPVKDLFRIECYDISNTSGKLSTGSMVVFINGEKDGSLYRKFKIRTMDTPNDFAMMQEVLQRRMKHEEWPYPDLIIVDGGKGQVSSAVSVLKERNIMIRIIGIAKKEETIITSDFKEIMLPKESNALKLVMRIRDEAHRFAITYHRKLRSKALILAI